MICDMTDKASNKYGKRKKPQGDVHCIQFIMLMNIFYLSLFDIALQVHNTRIYLMRAIVV